jgi:hypothetical protein
MWMAEFIWLSNRINGIFLYVGVLISRWLFLFAAQPKEFFLGGLKKLEQRSYKCVELRGEYVIICTVVVIICIHSV